MHLEQEWRRSDQFVGFPSKKTVRRDVHLNDLLVLPPNSDLHDHPMYISGELILQVN
jgi:hypothetical protein